MRRALIAATLLGAAGAHADAPRISVLAIGGGWITGHSNDERHGGLEAAIARDLGDSYRVGGGLELLQYVIHDDECYGSTGQFVGAFATAGLREPTADVVHFFVDARVGARVVREFPSCYPARPIRYDALPYVGAVAGLDIGGSTRARIQLSVAYIDWVTELALGAGVSF